MTFGASQLARAANSDKICSDRPVQPHWLAGHLRWPSLDFDFFVSLILDMRVEKNIKKSEESSARVIKYDRMQYEGKKKHAYFLFCSTYGELHFLIVWKENFRLNEK